MALKDPHPVLVLALLVQGEIVLPFYSTTCACGNADKPLGFDETYHSDIAQRFSKEEWEALICTINRGFSSRLVLVAKYFYVPFALLLCLSILLEGVKAGLPLEAIPGGVILAVFSGLGAFISLMLLLYVKISVHFDLARIEVLKQAPLSRRVQQDQSLHSRPHTRTHAHTHTRKKHPPARTYTHPRQVQCSVLCEQYRERGVLFRLLNVKERGKHLGGRILGFTVRITVEGLMPPTSCKKITFVCSF